MKTAHKPWKHIHLVAGLLVKHHHSTDPSMLLGLRTSGVVGDLVMPVGGHLEENDLGIITGCKREIKEEAALVPLNGMRVAQLRVKIIASRTKFIVDMILFTEWTGHLKNKSGEFHWLKFLKFSAFPWDKMPGEKQWYTDVLLKHKRRLVHITCGKNRGDVLSVRISNLK